ncbi:MAG TPA: VWA domain-containing protein [Pyrinomonadaceae bacterium]|nr:VWA domain-containing protein [Pyrinomonadaceae bacterium]
MISRSRKLACPLFLLVICAQLFAQQPAKPTPSPTPDDDVIRINTNVVQVDATVVDKHGKIVTDLKAEDFEIVEEGKNFRPEYFSFIPLIEQSTEQVEGAATSTTPKPITVDQVKRTFVFLVDNPMIDLSFNNANAFGMSSVSVSMQRRTMRGAVEAERLLTWFIDTQMAANDIAAIVDTELNIGKLSNYTNDRELLKDAIRLIREKAVSNEKAAIRITSVNGNPNLQPLIQQNLRVIALLSKIIDQTAKIPGRKVVSLVSRGLMYDTRLPGSDIVRARLDELIAKANRERVTIYTMSPTAIDNLGGVSMSARSRTTPGRISDFNTTQAVQDIDSLQHLASETGGRAIYATNDVRVGFAQVLEENRGYYLLGFNPGAESTGKPHKVKVIVKRPGLKVQARGTAYTRSK